MASMAHLRESSFAKIGQGSTTQQISEPWAAGRVR